MLNNAYSKAQHILSNEFGAEAHESLVTGKIGYLSPPDKPGSNVIRYILHLDDNPVLQAWRMDWGGSDDKRTFKLSEDGNVVSIDRARIEREQRAREAKREKSEAFKTQKAIAIYTAGNEATTHPYTDRKAVKVPAGCRIIHKVDAQRIAPLLFGKDLKTGQPKRWEQLSGRILLVPIFDAQGNQTGVQGIGENGTKATYGPMLCPTFTIQGDPTKPIYLAEGLATGASIHMATGATVVICFNANGLERVAPVIRGMDPGAQIIIAADNDRFTDLNPGLSAGIRAAVTAKALIALPMLDGNSRKLDFNDLHTGEGLPSVAKALKPIEPPRQINTFDMRPVDEVPGQYETAMKAIGKTDSPQEAARTALKVLHRFGMTVPLERTEKALVTDIQNAAPLLFHPDTLKALLKSMEKWTAQRRNKALASIALSDEVKARHNVKQVKTLLEVPITELGVHCVKAGHGTGKTQRVIAPAVQNCVRGRFENVLTTCHRRSLTAELAERTESTHYGETREVLDVSKAVATCVNSVIADRMDGVILNTQHFMVDEVSQVARHMAIGSCGANATERVLIYDTFKDLVAQSRTVIAADADLNDAAIRLLEAARPGERFNIYEIPPDNSGKKVNLVTGAGTEVHVVGQVLAHLKAGERVSFSTDSKKWVERIVELVRFEMPEVPVLGITGDNKGRKDQAAFLENPDKEAEKYQLLAYSPVISSGISIQGTHFDYGFGLYVGGTITPSDAIQQLLRPRMVREWLVGVVAKRRQDTESPFLMQEGIRQAAGRKVELSEFDLFEADHKAARNAVMNDFATSLFFQLEHLSFEIAQHTPGENENEALRDMLAEISKDLKAGWYEMVIGADDVTESEYDWLMHLEDPTDGQLAQIIRYRVKEDLAIEAVTVDDLDFWSEGRGMTPLRRFELAAGYKDGTEKDEDGPLALRRFDAVKAELLRYFLEPLNLDLRTAQGSYTATQAKEAIRRIFEKPVLAASLRIVPQSIVRMGKKEIIVKQPAQGREVPFINRVLALLGIQAKATARKGRRDEIREREYSLKPGPVALLNRYAETRFGVQNSRLFLYESGLLDTEPAKTGTDNAPENPSLPTQATLPMMKAATLPRATARIRRRTLASPIAGFVAKGVEAMTRTLAEPIAQPATTPLVHGGAAIDYEHPLFTSIMAARHTPIRLMKLDRSKAKHMRYVHIEPVYERIDLEDE